MSALAASIDTRPEDRPRSAVIERALEIAREFLGMDAAFVADTRQGVQDNTAVVGDGASFGLEIDPSRARPLEETYCARMLDGEIGHVVADAREDDRVRELQATRDADLGSYVGVPILLRDGSAYGTFCCLSHAPAPGVGERELKLMHILARLIGAELEREDVVAERQRVAARTGSVAALVAALEARDGYTEEHSRAVVQLAAAVGRELGLTGADLADLETVALLHDIGKLGVSDAVLSKPGKLTALEWEEMRRHPEIGARIVESMPGLADLAPAIRAEHESWDGSGYPDGLRGDAIPLASRIVLVCDAYHAMTSNRPYRRSIGEAAAREELHRCSGRQFCPTVTRAALAVLAPDEFDARITAAFGPDAAVLVSNARAHDALADDLDIRAGLHTRHGKPASAAIARRKANEHRDFAREARARAAQQRDHLSRVTTAQA